MIVVLNGFPGTGKHTILKKLQALLPTHKSCLIDNHLLIDPAQALYPDRSEEHHALRREIRAVFFPWVSRLAQDGYIILMTACLAANNDRDAAFFQEHLDVVRGTTVPLFWINAHCDQVRLEERVQSLERIHSTKTKLTDVSILRELVKAHRLLEPEHLSDPSTKLVVNSLDTSGDIDQSVGRLMEIVGLPCVIFNQGLEFRTFMSTKVGLGRWVVWPSSMCLLRLVRESEIERTVCRAQH